MRSLLPLIIFISNKQQPMNRMLLGQTDSMHNLPQSIDHVDLLPETNKGHKPNQEERDASTRVYLQTKHYSLKPGNTTNPMMNRSSGKSNAR